MCDWRIHCIALTAENIHVYVLSFQGECSRSYKQYFKKMGHRSSKSKRILMQLLLCVRCKFHKAAETQPVLKRLGASCPQRKFTAACNRFHMALFVKDSLTTHSHREYIYK